MAVTVASTPSASFDGDDELVPPPLARAIAEKLPEAVAVAVIHFLTTALVANPHPVGKQVRDDLAGVWSARRGTWLGSIAGEG